MMGSNEGHFKGQCHTTRCPQATAVEEKGEPKLGIEPTAFPHSAPDALPLG